MPSPEGLDHVTGTAVDAAVVLARRRELCLCIPPWPSPMGFHGKGIWI